MVNQFFEFVRYIVGNCQAVNFDVRGTVSEILYGWRNNLQKVSSPVASVLGIYAVAMDYVMRNVHLQHGQLIFEHSNDVAIELLNDMEHLQIFADSLDVLRDYFHSSSGPTCSVLDKCAKRVSSLSLECKTSRSCNQVHGEVSRLSYVDALGFLCEHMEEYVNTAWKHMITEKKGFICADINHVHNAFSQYCDFFLHEFRCNEQSESEMLHKNRVVMIRAAVASLKISLGLSEKNQMMVTSIDQLVSCQWIKPRELKYLASSFYSVGVSLYNVGQVKKASVALQLCCRTLWTHVRMLCQLFSNESPIIYDGNLSEDVIKDAITDACAKSAVALDVIHECGDTDLHIIVVNSLLSWSAAYELLETIANPSLLVKQWAKIGCKDSKDANAVDSVPVLYSLLSSKCEDLSKRTLCIILE
ncbi:hypothetical protein Taro_032907, partial [Colocasia esculenta]|nr:hypothetical protein [Colocasia esculenta]